MNRSRLAFIFVAALLLVDHSLSTQNFRSILIQRACTKKPDLELCADFTTPPSVDDSTTTTTDAPVTIASENAPSGGPIELVLPPNPESLTSTTAATTTTTPNQDDEVDFGEDDEAVNTTLAPTAEREKLGSLVRLPKPAKSSDEVTVEKVLKASGVSVEEEKKEKQDNSTTSVSIEDEKGVLVFVSEYCVVEREHFVKSCNGQIDQKEVSFCKTYPAACVSTNGVIPVISYCQRYYKHYPKHCTKQLVPKEALQFCFAFEQFCLPELQAIKAAEKSKPKSSLRKCEDVVAEARKVCNPFPNPKDTFNLLRCTQFVTNCKKFVDWL